MQRSLSLSLSLCALAAALAGSLLFPPVAGAKDILLFGDRVTIKPGRLVRVRASGAFVPPGADDDPTVHGGELRIFDTAIGGAGEAVFDLPAEGWKGRGKPPGTKGYLFKGGSCKVRLTTGRIRAACRGGVTLSPPIQDEVGVILQVGENTTRYCAQFGGSDLRNKENVVSRSGSGIPNGCSAIGQTPTPTRAPPRPTPTPNRCASLPDGQTCDAGTDGVVLTCESGVCGTCVPAGTCSGSGDACAFDEQCPGVETCTLGPDPSPRYVDNGDGTVTDRRTCLVWEQKTGTYDASFPVCPGGVTCGDPHEVDNRYKWTSSGTAFDGPAKTDFIDVLNTASFAGHGDWRLPESGGSPPGTTGEPAELESILLAPFPCGTSPCIDAIFGPTAPRGYWSATTFAPDPAFAWLVFFIDGSVSGGSRTGDRYVRAVRGGP